MQPEERLLEEPIEQWNICIIVQEFMHIQNQASKHVFDQIHSRTREIKNFLERNADLKNVCPIIQKI